MLHAYNPTVTLMKPVLFNRLDNRSTYNDGTEAVHSAGVSSFLCHFYAGLPPENSPQKKVDQRE